MRGEHHSEELERLETLSREVFGYDIVGLEFEDRLLLEVEDVFRDLAPFVEPGSYLLLHVGSGARWRYRFDGERMTSHDEGTAQWYRR